MRCREWGHRFRLTSCGMGYSDPPGLFFWIALGGLTLCLVSVVVLLAAGWALAVVPAAFGLALAAVAGVAIIPAVDDQNLYGGVKCPRCGGGQAIRPWSL